MKSSESLPSGWRLISTDAKEEGLSYLIIPKPSPGDWVVWVYWTHGISDTEAQLEFEYYCSSAANERFKTSIILSRDVRYSQGVSIPIQGADNGLPGGSF